MRDATRSAHAPRYKCTLPLRAALHSSQSPRNSSIAKIMRPPHCLSLLALIPTTCLALTLRLPSQINNDNNITTPSLSLLTNITHPGLQSDWPSIPITRHLAYETDLQILDLRPPPATDPTSESAVLQSISIIQARARARSRLALIQKFDEVSPPVTFRFRATDDLFRGSEVAMVLEALWEMTNRHGKAELYGALVRVGEYTAYFELRLLGAVS